MIVRDSYGFIVQHRRDLPMYQDGGDTCHKTSCASIGGSVEDSILLPALEPDWGRVVRHPKQWPWFLSTSTTRDQVIPYVTALYFAGLKHISNRVMLAHKRRGWRCQNTHTYEGKLKPWYKGADVLMPDARAHMMLCGGETPSKLYMLWADSFLWASLLWSTKVKPWDEQNNIICMVLVRGEKWVRRYVDLHPDYIKSTVQYWGGWRDQLEIGQGLIKKIEETMGVKR